MGLRADGVPFGDARGVGGGKDTKMVEKGSHHGSGDLPGRDGDGLERRGSRGTDFGTRGDEKCGIFVICQPILYDFGPPCIKYQPHWCPLSPFSRAHLSSPSSLAPEDPPWVSWAASDGTGVGGIPIWDARDAGVQRAARAGHTMGLGTAQGAMQTLWRVVGVVARALGRQGTKTFGFHLIFVT